MMIDHMAECLADGGRIEIRGFANFSLRFHRARVERNPGTGTPVSVPARFRAFQGARGCANASIGRFVSRPKRNGMRADQGIRR